MKNPALLHLDGLFKNDRRGPPFLQLPPELFVDALVPLKLQPSGRSEKSKAGTSDAKLPAIGSVIEKYRIEQLLGTGGFAVVYRATHLLLRVPVCIKMLKPKIVKADPMLAELLCEEARFTALLNHPNVVRVMDVTHTDALTYIVMEYVDGKTLAATIDAKKRLDITYVLRIGLDVCRGLKAALEQGLIHRDIKPANILLARDGTARIVDFGLAHRRPRTSSGSPTKSAIRANAVVGTPLYMAPEQASHPERVDFRSDMYSLGVTLYHALTGRPPFSGESAAAVIHMHQIAEVRMPELPGEIGPILKRMLAKNPHDRFLSYDELSAALSACG